MTEQLVPVFCTIEKKLVIGTMAIYESQAEVLERVPHQWHEFRSSHPALGSRAEFYGASPCTDDGKIHYLTGIAHEDWDSSLYGERLILEAGEYAVVRVLDASILRQSWTWLLEDWLPASGRREKHAPEFEKFTGVSESGIPIGPVEIWIPLESISTNPPINS